ncbi:hypothetical protein Hamer_G022534 [Homarus americanus]|uniref:Uncharacterized protein n=1 Tax=Homarus americanus TaxID=6706 RepID=A0A8J5JZ30_HOMAM|nr:hypothetical protein Hamer_G022534 [Homarus americanus]
MTHSPGVDDSPSDSLDDSPSVDDSPSDSLDDSPSVDDTPSDSLDDSMVLMIHLMLMIPMVTHLKLHDSP